MMMWKGKELKTVGEIMGIVVGCKTRDEANEFMSEYRKHTPHADSNIGYFSGYYDAETMRRVLDLFDVSHPVFGKSIPTPRRMS